MHHGNFASLSIVVVMAMASTSPVFGRGLDEETAERQIEALRRERCDTLRMVAEAAAARHAAGTIDVHQVFAARHQLLKAELQLAKTHEQQVKKLEEIVENLQQIEVILQRRHEAGRGVVLSDALQAKAKRLKAAIRLLELKSSAE